MSVRLGQLFACTEQGGALVAEAPDGQLLHIDDVPSGLACNCACASCGRTMVAKKGDVHPRARMSPRKPAHEQRVPEFYVSSSVLRPCFAIRATAFLSKDANVSPPSQLPS